jgi:hypothetical protein
MMGGCQASTPAPPQESAVVLSAAQHSPADKGGEGKISNGVSTMHVKEDETKDDLNAFARDGAKLLDSQKGDLNGDGVADALLVLDPPVSGEEKLGEGPPRTVVLLARSASGHLEQVARNDRIVPCANCGGISGDPYGYTRLESAGFTIVNGGGGREHWTDEFTFKYSAEHKGWLLEKVMRRVTDRETDAEKRLDLTAKEFGLVRFEVFDPSTLPEVEWP